MSARFFLQEVPFVAQKRRGRPPKLHTLTEISQKTGISMPTLQRYKKAHGDRIPSVGEGRKQRYPTSAVAVFRQLKKEGLERRGRSASNSNKRVTKKRRGKVSTKKASNRKRGSTRKSGSNELLTLTEIERRTGISYPTLLRYVRLHGRRIPHRGKGRKRRYLPEAVEVFEQLRSQSRRGRKKRDSKPAGTESELKSKLRELEKAHSALARQVRQLERRLDRPVRVTLQR